MTPQERKLIDELFDRLASLEVAGRGLGLQLHVLEASTDAELEIAFATLKKLGISGLVVVGGDGFFTSRSDQLAALAIRHGVPAICPTHEFASAGGLISYGGSNKDSYSTAGSYADRILKGEKPTELPVLVSTKFDFVINLKTARALGLTIPPTMLALTTMVIE